MNLQHRNCFDLHLTDTYQPDKLKGDFLTVDAEMVDEDSLVPHVTTNSEGHGKMLVKELSKQRNLKHSLTIKFRVKLELPREFGSAYLRKPLLISHMALEWPFTTPHRMAKIRIGSNQSPVIGYDPEQGIIKWTGVTLKPPKELGNPPIYSFYSDVIQIEISEPIDFYEQLKLSGFVQVEVEGLFSRADLSYEGPITTKRTVVPTFHTILKNKFTMNLKESIESKLFLPRQHIYFPGVMLDEMRIADILMLLEDKGFEFRKSSETLREEGSQKKQYEIDAIRYEGAKSLEINLRIEGIDASTMRERNILGKAKYTTSLSRGDTSIYITGKMKGDSKRVVSVVNEIQKQLKEQFRHVGTVE
jgi:hypothetical protein